MFAKQAYDCSPEEYLAQAEPGLLIPGAGCDILGAMKINQFIGRQSYLKQAVIVTLILLALTFSLPIFIKSYVLFLVLSVLASMSFGVAIMQTRFFGRLVEWLNQHQPPRPRTTRDRLLAEIPSVIITLLLLLGLWLSTRQ